MRKHTIIRFSFYVFLAGPMYFCGYVGPMSAAIFGYVLCIGIYLSVQALTDFRHPLHGMLSVVLFAIVYALLVPALAISGKRSAVSGVSLLNEITASQPFRTSPSQINL